MIRDCLSDYVRATTENTCSIFRRVGIKLDKSNNVEHLYVKLNKQKDVKISKECWAIIDSANVPDIFFTVSSLEEDLPIPERNGDISLLKRVINCRSDADFKIMLAWLVYTFSPGQFGSKSLLIFEASHGSGKYKTSQFLKQLIDHGKVPLSTVRTENDIMILAKHDWLTVLDNLSDIKKDV
jgi:hypothetical protein